MIRWALIIGNSVANVVEQDDQPQVDGQWVACGDAGPGWLFDGVSFTNPSAVPAPAPQWSDPALDPRYFWIDVGRFNARLGVDAMAIAASTHDACKAAVALLGMSKFADLKGPELSNMLNLLIATGQPAANPIFPGSGPMTLGKKAIILNPVTTDYERHIKGLPQPAGA